MRRLTAEQAAIIGAYTGVLCGPFSDLHEYIEKKLGRPVFTHELGTAGGLWEKIKDATLEDFLAICHAKVEPRPEPRVHAPHYRGDGRTACNKFERWVPGKNNPLQPSKNVTISNRLEDVTCKVCLKSTWNHLVPDIDIDEGTDYDAAMDDERIKLRQGEV